MHSQSDSPDGNDSKSKTKSKNKTPTRLTIPIDYEVASMLTEEFNNYSLMLEEYDEMDVDWVLNKLLSTILPEDLEMMLADDFSRGLIMGQLHTIREIELAELLEDGGLLHE